MKQNIQDGIAMAMVFAGVLLAAAGLDLWMEK